MRLRLLVTGILFFMLAMAVLWPASAVVPWIADASKGRLRLTSPEGRLWSGSGVLQARTGDSTTWHSAQTIRWQVRWNELWRGRMGVEASFDNGMTLVTMGADGLSIEQLDATLPTSLIGVLLPGPLGRFGWAGTLSARGQDFSCVWQNRNCRGELELSWTDAAVAEIAGGELGDYRIRMVAEGPNLRFDLDTRRGRLQINGSGEVSINSFRFVGEATATGPSSAQLHNLLRTIGRQGATPDKILIDYRLSGTGG